MRRLADELSAPRAPCRRPNGERHSDATVATVRGLARLPIRAIVTITGVPKSTVKAWLKGYMRRYVQPDREALERLQLACRL